MFYVYNFLLEIAVYQFCLLFSSELKQEDLRIRNKRTGKPQTEMAGTSQYARAIYISFIYFIFTHNQLEINHSACRNKDCE